MENFRVFVDANGNGVYDPGEASTLTDEAGAFSLSTPLGTPLSGEAVEGDLRLLTIIETPILGFDADNVV